MTVAKAQTGPAPAPSLSQPLPASEFERLLAKDSKTRVEYEPFGSDQKIVLSVKIVQDYLAVPAKGQDGQPIYPDHSQCMKFIMLCRSRGLNPFEQDAWMLPFWDKNQGKHNWNLITAHQAFLKRAEVHPEYNGKKSGVIITPIRCKPCDGDGVIGNDKDKICPKCEGAGYIDELIGDFVPTEIDGEQVKLLGGWCKIFFKNRANPEHQRLSLDSYKQPFGRWSTDGAGMICKCAEAAALRGAFPTYLGGMICREEFNAAEEITKPAMDRSGKTAKPLFALPESEPDNGKATASAPEPPAQTNEPVPPLGEVVGGLQAEPEPPQTQPARTDLFAPGRVGSVTANKILKAVRGLATAGNIPEGKILELAASRGVSDGSATTLEELPIEALNQIHDNWSAVAQQIKGAK